MKETGMELVGLQESIKELIMMTWKHP